MSFANAHINTSIPLLGCSSSIYCKNLLEREIAIYYYTYDARQLVLLIILS